jgi:major membrane immunogen (membrane-anchored lipoprotein)
MNIKKINLICLIFLAFLVQPVFAMETTYPTIGGVSMPANPTFTNYFLYFFNLALFVGMVAAAVVMIAAGVRFMLSRGVVGQAEKSKGEMFRALIGLAILFGAILIVNAINSGINKSAIDDLHAEKYSGGIMLHYDDGKVVNLMGDLGEVKTKINSFDWLSKKEELPRVYIFPQKNFQGTPVEVDNPAASPSIEVGNSISFDWNVPGVYLYDDYEFKLKALKAPINIINSQPALALLFKIGVSISK